MAEELATYHPRLSGSATHGASQWLRRRLLVDVVFDRVASRTQHFKVSQVVVARISILVVNHQDFGVSVVAAALALLQGSTPLHPRPVSIAASRLSGALSQVPTADRTVLPVLAGRTEEISPTLLAGIGDRSFCGHGFVIARTRAVLGNILSVLRNLEVGSADLADLFDPVVLGIPHGITLTGTEPEGVESVARDADFGSALNAGKDL